MSNYNKPKNKYTFLLICFGLLCIGAIIWLKLVGDKRTSSGRDIPVAPQDSSNAVDDGAAHTPQASYDESNSFKTIDERAAYVRGYREGYAKGFEDGSKGQQFNISSNN